ncbi:Trehalose utilization [Thalassoglobus neptunius]|uniref:Trehalose utilization n=2 Tax=Thalassoglobus neptunius TaxID=1938619 RepID=A0A5C5WII1_9PLAN|nr:ThuA domain-containing protein [Thalassoglobus neptunius]TWT49905.1 Trehalose utilization [Thalassoglobus neptunius]
MTKLLIATFTILVMQSWSHAADLKALIIDGQNNHGDWPKTTFMMKKYLEETGLFDVDLARTKYTWKGEQHLPEYSIPGFETEATPQPKADPDFKPDFSKYDVVVSNFGFNAAPWPKETQEAFEEFVRNGGGLVIVHAADNSFGDWPEYNQMIGIGGWGGRDEKSGPYVYLNEQGEEVRDESPGRGGTHGPQHEFSIVIRDNTHPITKGLPTEWLHTKDELYSLLRGPGQQMQILATAYASPKFGGTDRHEPMLMTIQYGKGKVFHTPMGHADYSMECVGFKTCLQRGTEWAATGKVTQDIPDNFPTAESASAEPYTK